MSSDSTEPGHIHDVLNNYIGRKLCQGKFENIFLSFISSKHFFPYEYLVTTWHMLYAVQLDRYPLHFLILFFESWLLLMLPLIPISFYCKQNCSASNTYTYSHSATYCLVKRQFAYFRIKSKNPPPLSIFRKR